MNKNFDIYNYLLTRPLSWSALSSFEWSPEQWYETYILGKRQSSPEMTFGSIVDRKIQNDPKFLPTLPRYQEMQYKMKVQFGKVPLIGIPDGLNLRGPKLLFDYKSGVKEWNQKRANETGQLTFYLLLLYITHKIKPEEFICGIHWFPTVKKETGDFKVVIDFVPDINNNIKTFYTKRTMADLLNFGSRINKTVLEMQEYVRNHE